MARGLTLFQDHSRNQKHSLELRAEQLEKSVRALLLFMGIFSSICLCKWRIHCPQVIIFEIRSTYKLFQVLIYEIRHLSRLASRQHCQKKTWE